MPSQLFIVKPIIPFYTLPFTSSKIVCCEKTSSSSSSSSGDEKFKFKLVGPSLSDNIKLKINQIDTNAINKWVSRTQNFLNDFPKPLVKTVNDRKKIPEDKTQETDNFFTVEQTVNTRMPNGDLSIAAIHSIEQFSRMNGENGNKMQKIFKTLVPESVYYDARNLVEYCCFRFLSRDNSDIHPSLKEAEFQRLIFVTMLAWENPYSTKKETQSRASEWDYLKTKLIKEEAFVRIAPAISGVADWATVHNLFKALSGDQNGISFTIWSTYVKELLRVHDARKSNKFREFENRSERILCLSSNRKQPVLKWKNNLAWPGKLILTDRALYFEAVDFGGNKDAVRLDLTIDGSRVEKTRVGPLGSNLFDSAISVTSGNESETWALEFVDLGNEMRRDVWHALISEVIALYKFIREFGPGPRPEPGPKKGNELAIRHAINAIARLQALQYMRKLLDEPTKLVQFAHLQNATYGDVVLQTLAVSSWGGPVGEFEKQRASFSHEVSVSDSMSHVFDIDGSVYLRKWMRSSSWASNASVTFWKNVTVAKKGIIVGKNLVVGDINLIEKAARTFRDKYKVAETTQATIDAAMIEGIPNNIDLFKELVLPLSIVTKNFEKLRHWEDPRLTASFLAITYTLIFRNMLAYVFPTAMMILAAVMLLLKGLKEQGRLGRYFGKVTIKDQPPSNTIEKIIAVKAAMREVEKSLQNINIMLLKLRSILLAGQPQITTEIALVLLVGSTALMIIPFRYILSFFIFDLFTRELEFRRKMVLTFMSFLKERWDTVPATPVNVVPYEDDNKSEPLNQKKELKDVRKSKGTLSDNSKVDNSKK